MNDNPAAAITGNLDNIIPAEQSLRTAPQIDASPQLDTTTTPPPGGNLNSNMQFPHQPSDPNTMSQHRPDQNQPPANEPPADPNQPPVDQLPQYNPVNDAQGNVIDQNTGHQLFVATDEQGQQFYTDDPTTTLAPEMAQRMDASWHSMAADMTPAQQEKLASTYEAIVGEMKRYETYITDLQAKNRNAEPFSALHEPVANAFAAVLPNATEEFTSKVALSYANDMAEFRTGQQPEKVIFKMLASVPDGMQILQNLISTVGNQQLFNAAVNEANGAAKTDWANWNQQKQVDPNADKVAQDTVLADPGWNNAHNAIHQHELGEFILAKHVQAAKQNTPHKSPQDQFMDGITNALAEVNRLKQGANPPATTRQAPAVNSQPTQGGTQPRHADGRFANKLSPSQSTQRIPPAPGNTPANTPNQNGQPLTKAQRYAQLAEIVQREQGNQGNVTRPRY